MKKKSPPPPKLFLLQNTGTLKCDVCRKRPAVGYVEGPGERDALAVYCRECGGSDMKSFPRKFRRCK